MSRIRQCSLAVSDMLKTKYSAQTLRHSLPPIRGFPLLLWERGAETTTSAKTNEKVTTQTEITGQPSAHYSGADYQGSALARVRKCLPPIDVPLSFIASLTQTLDGLEGHIYPFCVSCITAGRSSFFFFFNQTFLV